MPLQTMSYCQARMSSGSFSSRSFRPPWGIEKGLWEKSILPVSSSFSYIGKSTIQQNRKTPSSKWPSALGGLDADDGHDLGDLVELAGAEEDRVARHEGEPLGERLDVGLGEELGDRSRQGAVLADPDPGQALGTVLDGVVAEAVEELPGLTGGVRDREGTDVLAA